MNVLRSRTAMMEVVLVIVAVILNLGLRYAHDFRGHSASDITGFANADSLRYCRIACGINQTGRFAFINSQDVLSILANPKEAAQQRFNATITASDPPLWPFVLSRLLRLTGYNIPKVLALRCLLDAGTVVLFAYLLLLTGIGFAARAIGLLLFAGHPAWLIYSTSLLTEPLTLFILVSFAVVFTLLTKSENSMRMAALTGVLGGLVMLEHPFYGMFPILCVLMLYGAGLINRKAYVISRSTCVVACLGIAVVAGPWMLRNMVVMHAPLPYMSSYDWPTARVGWNSGFLGHYRNTNWDLASNRFMSPAEVLQPGPDENRTRQLDQREVFEFVRSNWRIVPAIVARKLVGAITPIPETTRAGVLEDGRMLFQILAFIPVAMVMFLGIARRPFRILAVAIMVTNLVSSEIVFPSLRFRFPLIWAEMLSIAIFLDSAIRWFQNRSRSNREVAYGANGHTQHLPPV